MDGSHHSEEVLSDCLHCFSLLKINGLMIIDDIFIMSNKRFNDNTLKAIDLFLNFKKKGFKNYKIKFPIIYRKKI